MCSLSDGPQSGTWFAAGDCFGQITQRCWATNFDPNAGNWGSQSRTDNINQLPTWGYQNIPFGDGALPATTCGGDPPFGGDHVMAGSDANCGTPPSCSPPAGVSCNTSPNGFVTENYTDASGGWHFAMGGADQCLSNGGQVPCNVGHTFYPWDCREPGVSPNCSSYGAVAEPFNWGFPDSMYFEMKTNLYVGSVAGPFHSFLCADLTNGVNGSKLEICDEAYNSSGYFMPASPTPQCGGYGFVTWWQPAGQSNPYMTTNYAPDSGTGHWIAERWTMTRGQFINLINNAHAHCSDFPADTAMNNWKLRYSENGMESIGPAGHGAGISFEIQDETMITQY